MTRFIFCSECGKPLHDRIAPDGERHAECARAAEDYRRVSGTSSPAPLRFFAGPDREFLARVHPGAARNCGFAA